MKNYILLLISFFTFACNNVQNEQIAVADSETTLSIDGMTCEVGCKKIIEKNMRAQAGVIAFDIDFENKEAHIEFDSKMTDTEDLIAQINQINNGAYSATTK